jgi:hypothetical protein
MSGSTDERLPSRRGGVRSGRLSVVPISMPSELVKAHAELDRAVVKKLSPQSIPVRPRTRGAFIFTLRKTHHAAAASHAKNTRAAVTDHRYNAPPHSSTHTGFDRPNIGLSPIGSWTIRRQRNRRCCWCWCIDSKFAASENNSTPADF